MKDKGIYSSDCSELSTARERSSMSRVEQLNRLNQGRWGSLKSCKKERVDE